MRVHDMSSQQRLNGFTIVELLIVIVVIGILAAITIVSFNGIQQRGTNTAIISSARNAAGALQAYITANGTYPATASFCLTATSGCNWAGNVPANSSGAAPGNITAIASLPASTPRANDINFGVVYNYNSTRTFNGEVQPLQIVYILKGGYQECKLPNLSNSGGVTTLSTTNPFTATTSDVTTCVISIKGP